MTTSTNTFNFTKRAIDALPANLATSKSSEAEYTDSQTPGLKLAVNKQGRKTFLFRYTFSGQKRAMKLGDYGAIDIETARKLALQARGLLNQDIDPQASRAAAKAVPGFSDFAYGTYMPYSRMHKKSFKDDKSRLDAHIAPYLKNTMLTTITATDINSYLNHLRSKCKLMPATINRHRSLISAIFKHAIELDLLEDNPCRKVKKLKENNARDRFLTDQELANLEQAMEATNPTTGEYIEKNRTIVDLVRVLLMTGVRREEALGAKWSDIDLDKKLWHLPVTKNGKPRYVVLNDLAFTLLSRMHTKKISDWVLPNPKTGTRLINPDKGFKRLMARAEIANMRIHDLRHTFASIAVSNGVSLYQVQTLLGHASSQTTQRYAHLCADSLREASNLVGKQLAVTQGA